MTAKPPMKIGQIATLLHKAGAPPSYNTVHHAMVSGMLAFEQFFDGGDRWVRREELRRWLTSPSVQLRDEVIRNALDML